MSEFELHETLAADTVEAARWPLCRVLLMTVDLGALSVAAVVPAMASWIDCDHDLGKLVGPQGFKSKGGPNVLDDSDVSDAKAEAGNCKLR
jgi:hypothetical protein